MENVSTQNLKAKSETYLNFSIVKTTNHARISWNAVTMPACGWSLFLIRAQGKYLNASQNKYHVKRQFNYVQHLNHTWGVLRRKHIVQPTGSGAFSSTCIQQDRYMFRHHGSKLIPTVPPRSGQTPPLVRSRRIDKIQCLGPKQNFISLSQTFIP